MFKKDVIKKFQEVAERVDMKLSQEAINNILDILSVTTKECYKELEIGEKVTIGEFILEKKEVKKQTRTCTLPGKEGEYTTPAHTKPVGKLTTKFKKENKEFL